MMMTYRPVASPALSPPLLGIISMGFGYSNCLITTSEEVCLSVCFVCLSATSRKTADRYSWKFYQRYNLWTWNSPLNFQSHPDPDQNQGIFEGFFLPLCEWGNSAYFEGFLTRWYISLATNIRFLCYTPDHDPDPWNYITEFLLLCDRASS